MHSGHNNMISRLAFFDALPGGVLRFSYICVAFSRTVLGGMLLLLVLTGAAHAALPVANDDAETVVEDSVDNVFDVTANDTDDDGDTLTVSAASASNGTADPVVAMLFTRRIPTSPGRTRLTTRSRMATAVRIPR